MSRFVNFSRFLNANRDAAQQSAERVAGGIEGQANDLEPQIEASQKTFNAGVQAGTPKEVGMYGNRPFDSALGMYTPMARNDVQSLASAQYGGPTSIAQNTGWGALTNRAQQAGDAANATGTAGGLGALMGRHIGLDTATVGAAGADRFAALRQRLGGISGRLRDMTTASEQAAAAAKQNVDAARGWAQNAQTGFETADAAARQRQQAGVDEYERTHPKNIFDRFAMTMRGGK